MPTTRKPKPKAVSPAERKRRVMAAKSEGKKKPNPMAKKKISNKTAMDLMKKQAKARKFKRATKNHQNKGRNGRTNA